MYDCIIVYTFTLPEFIKKQKNKKSVEKVNNKLRAIIAPQTHPQWRRLLLPMAVMVKCRMLINVC